VIPPLTLARIAQSLEQGACLDDGVAAI
jgi:hypothetical protein